MESIDTNLYSRQMGTFGRVLMERLLRMKILIVGMRGLGVETAKNIILSVLIPMLLHGAYDYFLMSNSSLLFIAFVIFIVLLYIVHNFVV